MFRVRGYRGVTPLNSESPPPQGDRNFISPPSLPLGPPPALLGSGAKQPRVLIPNHLPPALRDNPAILIPPELAGLKPTSYPPSIIFTSSGLTTYPHPHCRRPHPSSFHQRRRRSAVKETISDLTEASKSARKSGSQISHNVVAPQFQRYLAMPRSLEDLKMSHTVLISGAASSCPTLPSLRINSSDNPTDMNDACFPFTGRSRERERWDAEAEELGAIKSGCDGPIENTENTNIVQNMNTNIQNNDGMTEAVPNVEIMGQNREESKGCYRPRTTRFPSRKAENKLHHLLPSSTANHSGVIQLTLESLEQEKLRLKETREALLRRLQTAESTPKYLSRKTKPADVVADTCKGPLGIVKLHRRRSEISLIPVVDQREKVVAAATKRRLIRMQHTTTNIRHTPNWRRVSSFPGAVKTTPSSASSSVHQLYTNKQFTNKKYVSKDNDTTKYDKRLDRSARWNVSREKNWPNHGEVRRAANLFLF